MKLKLTTIVRLLKTKMQCANIIGYNAIQLTLLDNCG